MDTASQRLIDEHLDPVIADIDTMNPDEFAGIIIATAVSLRLALKDAGVDLTPAQVGLEMQCRSLQRVAGLQRERDLGRVPS